MRADNNWEDEIGKRLRELETAPPPMAWNKIKQDIAPKRSRRWLWVPFLVLFFAGLPLTYFMIQKQGETPDTNLVLNQPANNDATISAPAKTTLPANAAIAQSQTTEKTSGSENAVTPSETSEPVNQTIAANQIAVNQTTGKVTTEVEKPTGKTNAVVPVIGSEKPNRPGTVKFKDLPTVAETRTLAAVKTKTKSTTETATRQTQTTTSSIAFASEADVRNAGKNNAAVNSISENTNPEITKNANGTITETTTKNAETGKTIASVSLTEDQEDSEKTNETKSVLKGETIAENAADVTSQTIAQTPEESKNQTTSLTDSALAVTNQNLALSKTDSTQKPEKPNDEPPTEPEPKSRNTALALYFMPQQTYQRISANQTDDVMLVRFNEKEVKQVDRLGYELGLQGSMQVNEKFWLETTLHYMKLRQQLSFTTTSGQSPDSIVLNQSSTGGISMDLYKQEEDQLFLAHYHYFGAYLGLAYHVTEKFQVTGGYGLNWLGSWENENASVNTNVAIGSNPFLRAGLRYNFVAGKNLNLQVGPTVQYFLSSIQNDASIFSSKPVTIGITAGLQLRKR